MCSWGPLAAVSTSYYQQGMHLTVLCVFFFSHPAVGDDCTRSWRLLLKVASVLAQGQVINRTMKLKKVTAVSPADILIRRSKKSTAVAINVNHVSWQTSRISRELEQTKYNHQTRWERPFIKLLQRERFARRWHDQDESDLKWWWGNRIIFWSDDF